jgi:hypothetical protein
VYQNFNKKFAYIAAEDLRGSCTSAWLRPIWMRPATKKGPAISRGRGESTHAPREEAHTPYHFVLTSIDFGCAAGVFGSASVSKPFVKVASILSRSMSFGSTKLRENELAFRSFRM